MWSPGGVRKLVLALALPQKTADGVLTASPSEKPQRGPTSEQREPLKTALVVFKCAPHILNTRIIECYPYGEKPDPAHLVRVWVKSHLHPAFRPRQLIPPGHLRPYGVAGQWVYVASQVPRKQI